MSDYISEELLILILKGLPVKSLLQFRCVCKSWKQMIDSRSFILDHLAIQSHVLLVQNIRSEYPEYEFLVQNIRPEYPEYDYLVFDPDDLNLLGKLVGPDGVQTQINHPVNDGKHYYCLTVVSTVHGVICLYDNENRLFLWNPSIRRLLRIPVPEVRSDAGDLVYDPDLFDFRCCGFWMDPSNNGFKIVILFIPERKYAIFNSRNQAWIEVNIESVRLREDSWEMTNNSPMILLDGVGYWMLHDESDDGVIVYFDFGQDKLGTIDIPKLVEEEEEDVLYNKCIIRWVDYVAIVHWQDETCPSECKLWVMKNGSWRRPFRWKCHEHLEFPLYVAGAFELVLVQSKRQELVTYDAEDGWKILDFGPFSRGGHRLAYDFVESLVFPDSDCSSTGSVSGSHF